MDTLRQPTTKGLKPNKRKLATISKKKKLTANQWQNTPQQNNFMEYWLTPSCETFSNAYKSALKAGYSEHYANQITAKNTGNEWIREYLRRSNMDVEHVKQIIQDLILNPKSYNNSRSPADTRVKAMELYSKILGMVDNKGNTTNILVQPILNGESVKIDRTVIDSTVIDKEIIEQDS